MCKVLKPAPSTGYDVTDDRNITRIFLFSNVPHWYKVLLIHYIMSVSHEGVIQTLPGWPGRGVYRVLVGRPEGKRPLGRHRRRWKDNIKMDLREIGIDGVNWIQLA
jgi:hypothetical protein